MNHKNLGGKNVYVARLTPILTNTFQALLIVLFLLDNRMPGQQKPTTIQDCAMRYQIGELYEGLTVCNAAVRHFEALSDRRSEATTLNILGNLHSALGDKQKALEYYNNALTLQRATGDHHGEATSLSNIGSVLSALGNKQEADRDYTQALTLQRALGDRPGEATTLNNIGVLYYASRDNRKALEYYNQALTLHRATGDRRGEATTLSNVGNLHSAVGNKLEAEGDYNQALTLQRMVGDRRGEATTLDNIAHLESTLGDKKQALLYLQQALAIQTAIGDHQGAATTLSSMGSVYSVLGEKSTALQCYEQVLMLQRAVDDQRGQATTLNIIGNLKSALGDNESALECFKRALPIAKAVGDRPLKELTLNNIRNTRIGLFANVVGRGIGLFRFSILFSVFGLVAWLWRRWKLRGLSTWPTTEARIECRSIARDDKGRTWACRLGYSYTVGGEYFAGFAEKTFRSEELALAFRDHIKDGQRTLIRYKGRHPETSVLDLRILEKYFVPETQGNTNDGRNTDSQHTIQEPASLPSLMLAGGEMSTLPELYGDSAPNTPDDNKKTQSDLSVAAFPKHEQI
jgi:tetratricopeptide (TPR) repeat protein